MHVILAGLHFAIIHCTLPYGISCILSAVASQAERALGQTSKFGALLDMVTGRYTTSCLLCCLSSSYPNYATLFHLLIALDRFSQYHSLVDPPRSVPVLRGHRGEPDHNIINEKQSNTGAPLNATIPAFIPRVYPT